MLSHLYKLSNIYRLGWVLAVKLVWIYIKKLCKRAPSEKETALINYYHVLIICNCCHLYRDGDSIVFKNRNNTFFQARWYPSSDLQVFLQIWKGEEYKPVVEYIKQHVKEKKLNIVDAGANVGYSTLYLNATLSRQFSISFICVEPSEKNVDILTKNISLNKISDINIEKAGLFNKSCYLRILNNFRDGRDWSLQIEESDVPSDLKSVEILNLIEQYRFDIIDFFKIDIEGAERYLFDNPSYAGNFLQKVRVISIEIHDEFLIRDQIIKILKDNYFTLSESGEIIIGINNILMKRDDI